MRDWWLGTSLAAVLILSAPIAVAQTGQAHGTSSGHESGGQATEQNRAGAQGQESRPSGGREGTAVQQNAAPEQGERSTDRGERSEANQERRSRVGEEGREGDRRYRSEREHESDRRFDEGRRRDYDERYREGGRYGERYEGRRSYEGRDYEHRRYGSRVEHGYSGPRNLQVTRRQRARVHDILIRRHLEPAEVDFPVRIGARVPGYVRSYEIPDEVYDYAPGYEGYRYFVVNDEIVIVDPDTMEVVAVLDD